MRVIAGRLRGRRIEAPRGGGVRPSYDRVRESVFAILGDVLVGASVLDLFAGSGSLAIEAISRGAAGATLVEIDRRALETARRNLTGLGIAGSCLTIRGDALAVLRRGAPGAPFDVVFVDPPYAGDLRDAALELLGGGGTVRSGGVVVVERGSATPTAARYGSLVRGRSERYGTTTVDFFAACPEGREGKEAA